MTDRHRLWELDRRGRSARVWPRLPGRRPRAPSRAEERAGRASRAPARARGSDRCDRPAPVSAERGPCRPCRPCKCSPPASSEAGPRPQFGLYCTHVSSSPLCSNHKRGGCYGDWTGGAEPVNGRGSGRGVSAWGGRKEGGDPERAEPAGGAGVVRRGCSHALLPGLEAPSVLTRFCAVRCAHLTKSKQARASRA